MSERDVERLNEALSVDRALRDFTDVVAASRLALRDLARLRGRLDAIGYRADVGDLGEMMGQVEEKVSKISDELEICLGKMLDEWGRVIDGRPKG